MNEKDLKKGQELVSQINEIKRNLEQLKSMKKVITYDMLKIETKFGREDCYIWTYDAKVKSKILSSITLIFEKELEKKQKEFDRL